MGLSRTLDLTADYNGVTNPDIRIDLSGWDTVIVQAVLPGLTININATNDAGAITGVTDGNAISAKNFVAVQGTNQATGASVTSITGNSMIRFGVVGKFMQLTSTGAATASGLFVYLYKIS